MAEFTELNVADFDFFELSSKSNMNLNLANLPSAKYRNLYSNENFCPVSYLELEIIGIPNEIVL